MPYVPSHPTRTAAPNGQDRRGGATQMTPEPGTNGRTNDRDNHRILRIALAVVLVAFLGVLAFNAFWLPGTGSSTETPTVTETVPNTVPGTNTPARVGRDPAPR